tara:strand:- start:119 stop:682 length:564 start_codon:yes stop_codon:yes gene_type:complete
MKTFQQFMIEVYDPEVQGRSQITKPGEGGRIGRKRKQTDAEKRRVRSVGGGKTVPAKTYKDKADIGKQNVKRSPAGRQQQPTQPKGVKLTAREQQRKARAERLAAKTGVKTKTADELLAKKAKKAVDPNYKAPKASGLTQKERQALTRQGEKRLRDIRLAVSGKKSERELKHPITHKEVARRKKENK